jgi:hypothetical protein
LVETPTVTGSPIGPASPVCSGSPPLILRQVSGAHALVRDPRPRATGY